MALIVAFLVSSCHQSTPESKRPKSVPLEAIWVGGEDGGCYIKHSYERKTNLVRCIVYNEFSGQIEAGGNFKFSDSTTSMDQSSLEFTAFDGKRIYLKNGAVLLPPKDVICPVPE